ncbi:hypothetical protein C0991_011987 [Blastosporella zonata]|nr:hypothetical protein C0991_011987 [Blastosporella zonata]
MPLNGELLIVDDEDPAIGYSGTWIRNRGTFVIPVAGPINLLEFLPLNGATADAQYAILNPVAEFNFTGGPFTPADGSSPNSNGNDNNRTSHAKSPPISTIVGAAVGGVAVLLLTLLVFLFRKRIFGSRRVSKLSVSEKRDISPFPLPNDTDTSVELPTELHRLEPQRTSVPTQERIVIPDIEAQQRSPLQQLMRTFRSSHDRQSSALTPFSVPPDHVPEENIHRINARLQQLQEIAIDIQREIAETQSSIPSDVPIQLEPPTESRSRSDIDSRMDILISPRPASLYPPPYNQTEEEKDERIRRFLAATS